MKNEKGISIVKLIFIVVVVVGAILIISKIVQINQRKANINNINDSAATYNLDVLKKNKIIVTYYPNVQNDLLYKEVKRIPLDTANSKNYDYLMDAYLSEHKAVMEFNDTLLEYYREILK